MRVPARPLGIVAALAASLAVAAVAALAEEAATNPHRRESCLRCHKNDAVEPDAGKTRILSSREEPHAAVAASCRSCHTGGKQDFWLLVLPPEGEGSSPPPGFLSAPAPGDSVSPAKTAPGQPAPPARPVEPAAAPEGFENSHDAMACAGCHDKPKEQLKPGSPPPPKFASQGAEIFCRSCHSGVNRTHFPRGNLPAAGTTCVSCHRAHGRALLFPSLRDDFPGFLVESTGLNPHGGKIFCLVCHQDTPQPGAPVALRFPDNSLRLCQRCHPGVEHHPLKVVSTPETWKMDFSHTPLENEGVVCISCHKPLECRGATGSENPRHLRGGPYNSVQEFCHRCHEDKKLSSLNPHDQIDETGTIYRKKCLYCHVSVPEAGEGGGGLRLTDTLTALCVSCHQTGAHPARDHLVRMTPSMMTNLRDYEERRQVRLPLEENSGVTCATCHNPHERGLIKGPAGVGADEETRLRLTTYNEQCSPCHGRH